MKKITQIMKYTYSKIYTILRSKTNEHCNLRTKRKYKERESKKYDVDVTLVSHFCFKKNLCGAYGSAVCVRYNLNRPIQLVVLWEACSPTVLPV